MQIYSVGRHEMLPCEFETVDPDVYEWLCYDYTNEGYEGWGMVIALRKDGKLQSVYLGHCSCYGPMDSWGKGEIVTRAEFFRKKVSIFDNDWSERLKAKVRELLNA